MALGRDPRHLDLDPTPPTAYDCSIGSPSADASLVQLRGRVAGTSGARHGRVPRCRPLVDPGSRRRSVHDRLRGRARCYRSRLVSTQTLARRTRRCALRPRRPCQVLICLAGPAAEWWLVPIEPVTGYIPEDTDREALLHSPASRAPRPARLMTWLGRPRIRIRRMRWRPMGWRWPSPTNPPRLHTSTGSRKRRGASSRAVGSLRLVAALTPQLLEHATISGRFARRVLVAAGKGTAMVRDTHAPRAERRQGSSVDPSTPISEVCVCVRAVCARTSAPRARASFSWSRPRSAGDPEAFQPLMVRLG